MRYTSIAILSIALVGCSSVEPVAIRGGEVCFRCGRVIDDARLGAELIRTNGHASVFRTPGCLAKYLQDHPEDVKAIFVTDYPSGKLIPVSNATFVRATLDKTTHERDYYAYRSVSDAAKRAADENSAVVDWSAIRTFAGAEKGN